MQQDFVDVPATGAPGLTRWLHSQCHSQEVKEKENVVANAHAKEQIQHQTSIDWDFQDLCHIVPPVEVWLVDQMDQSLWTSQKMNSKRNLMRNLKMKKDPRKWVVVVDCSSEADPVITAEAVVAAGAAVAVDWHCLCLVVADWLVLEALLEQMEKAHHRTPTIHLPRLEDSCQILDHTSRDKCREIL